MRWLFSDGVSLRLTGDGFFRDEFSSAELGMGLVCLRCREDESQACLAGPLWHVTWQRFSENAIVVFGRTTALRLGWESGNDGGNGVMLLLLIFLVW